MHDFTKSYPSCKPLSRQEELVLVEQFRNGATKAEREASRHKLLASITPFAFSMAKSMRWTGLSLKDLMQFAMMGADKGLNLFKPERGVRLLTYAAYWIRNLLQRGAADTSKTVRIPLQVWAIARKVSSAACRLQISGIGLTPELIAAETKLPIHKVLWVLEGIHQKIETIDPLPGDSPLRSRRNTAGANTREFADHRVPDPEAHIDRQRRFRALRDAIDDLDVSERAVIERRFCENPMTLKEIGDAAAEWSKSGESLSRERVRQIEEKALVKLRHLLQSNPAVSP